MKGIGPQEVLLFPFKRSLTDRGFLQSVAPHGAWGDASRRSSCCTLCRRNVALCYGYCPCEQQSESCQRIPYGRLDSAFCRLPHADACASRTLSWRRSVSHKCHMTYKGSAWICCMWQCDQCSSHNLGEICCKHRWKILEQVVGLSRSNLLQYRDGQQSGPGVWKWGLMAAVRDPQHQWRLEIGRGTELGRGTRHQQSYQQLTRFTLVLLQSDLTLVVLTTQITLISCLLCSEIII